MLSGNINTLTLVFLGFFLVIALAMFALYALLNGNNTQTLADSVRTALIENRDDASRVSSKTIYPLNVDGFEHQVETTKLQEVKNHTLNGNKGTEFHFYYLLQNGDLVNTDNYQAKASNNEIKHGNKTTLIKGVTVDVAIDTKDAKHDKEHNHILNRSLPSYHQEQEMKASPKMKRYSVTYLIDGGVVSSKDSVNKKAEAKQALPDNYQKAGKASEVSGNDTMLNLTDN